MVHCITGFVGRWQPRDLAGRQLADGARVVALDQGFGFLVLDEETATVGEPADPRLMATGARLSADGGSVALVATCYYGGIGSQAAAAWRDGRLVLPWQAGTGGAINAALAAIGVDASGAHDAFDAIGLGRHRRNDQWIAAGIACR